MLKARVEGPDDLNPQETAEWMEALDDTAAGQSFDVAATDFVDLATKIV